MNISSISIDSMATMPVLNTSSMAHRRAERNEELANKHYEKLSEHYDVKRTDHHVNSTNRLNHEEAKYNAEIDQYLALKRHVEYGLYQYGKFLGANLDVYV